MAAQNLIEYLSDDEAAQYACSIRGAEDENCQDNVFNICVEMLIELPDGEAIVEQAQAMREERPFEEVLNFCKRAADVQLGLK